VAFPSAPVPESNALPNKLPRLYLALALSISFAAYTPLLNSYFCGFDDFTELKKAAFDDALEPAKMLTTSHFGSPKYRPFNRLWNWSTYQLGGGSPWLHRWRNVLWHLIGVVAVIRLAQLAGQSALGAALAGTAFGIHPLAHQSVAAASWSNSAAYACALWSWFFLASSWHCLKPVRRIAAGALFLFLALFTYEATLVILGPLVLDLCFRRLRHETPMAGWAALLRPWSAAVGLVLICFVLARYLFAVGRMPISSPLTIAKNSVLYLGSLLMPLDLVLLNGCCGFPLPSQIVSRPEALLLLGAVCLLFLIAVALLWRRFPRGSHLAVNLHSWWWLLGIPMALSPFLLNTDHASETYLYLPVALWCLWLAGSLEHWLRSRAALAIAAFLLLPAFLASVHRSQRVQACADTAQSILANLPVGQWKTSDPLIFLRHEHFPPPPRFGLYSFSGLATIDAQVDGIPAIQAALQVASGNIHLRAKALDPDSFEQACQQPRAQCFLISAKGQVTPSR
jgi:hypothetical protein